MPTTPTDPLYGTQTHFSLLGDIETIWDEFTGFGVSVGIYGSGVQHSHPDLTLNYDPSLHFNYSGVTYDPVPIGTSTYSGTASAGIIGATEGNGIGGVGVAWDVSLTGVNLLGQIWSLGTPAIIAAIEWGDNFDIVNNSWGFTADFGSTKSLADPASFISQINDANELSVENGRGGLGTIIVQQAGNDTLNANGDGMNASRFSINVGATDNAGDASYYSNFGSSLLITAPAGGSTTDLTGADGLDPGDYTSTLLGASAAASVTSGVIALMLEANPGLGWRDVQNILALSASHTGSAYDAVSAGYEQGA